MSWLRSCFRRLRALFRRDRLDADMAEEMRAHLELQAAEFEQRGMGAAEARAAARRSFGGVEQVKERARDQRALRWVDDVSADVRYALRVIARAPIVSAVIVLSLAFGLGANTAVYSWIQTVALEPLVGVREGQRVMVVDARNSADLVTFSSAQEWRDIRTAAAGTLDLAAHNMRTVAFEDGGRNVRVWCEYVTFNFFSMLGVPPVAGRGFTLEDDRPGAPAVAVISHRLWQTQFGGRPDVVGRTLHMRNRTITVVGIAPADFQGGVTAITFDIWMPLSVLVPPQVQTDRTVRMFQLFGRLRPGATTAEANAVVAQAMARLARDFPGTNRGVTAEAIPMWRSRIGAQAIIVPTLATLQTVMVLLLLIVCTNTANLLLAQAATRTKEIAIRLSLGAGRARIIRQLLTEGLLLALAGAGLGLLIAFFGLDQINRLPKPAGLPVAITAQLDWSAVVYSGVLAVVCAVAFGLVPALQTTRTNLNGSLKLGGHTSGAVGRRRLQEVLVGAEIALTVVIVILAGLFVKSFKNARLADPGFRAAGVTLATLDFASSSYSAAQARAFAEKLMTRVKALPGVESAAFGQWVPLDLTVTRPSEFTLEGLGERSSLEGNTLMGWVSRDYFKTLGIEWVEGETFSAEFDELMAPEVVVNEEFCRRYLPDRKSPLGQWVTAYGVSSQIVGVVRTGKYNTLHEAPQPMVYLSSIDRLRYMTLFVHSEQDPAAVATDLRRAAQEISRDAPLFELRTLPQHVDQLMILRAIPAKILSKLGPLALFLALSGLYSVLAYAVTQRTHEIGVRMALGATPRAVISLILRQGLTAAGIGLGLGWVGAYALSIRLSRELVAVPAGDPTLFYSLPFLLTAVAAAACWLPARRAAKVDPMVALRAD